MSWQTRLSKKSTKNRRDSKKGCVNGWNCETCGNMNDARMDTCNKCQAGKSEQQSYPMGGGGGYGMGGGGHGMGGDFGKGDGCGMGGGYGIGMGGPHKGERGTSSEGLEIRPGDWKCLECKNVNFSWRDKCNKCEKHKGDAVPIMQGSGRSHGSQRRGLGGPLEARPEDWVCTTC